MKEEFLHAVWKHGLHVQPLRTIFDETVDILSRGILNHDSGPDFSYAKIRIGDTVWAGAVEVHVRSSHWYSHRHSSDPAYDNVILHIVWEEDRPVYDKYGVHIPTVELKNQVLPGAMLNFDRLELSGKNIPCTGLAHRVRPITKAQWKDRMAVERLQERRELHLKWLEEMNYNWDGVLFRSIARGMGFGVNSEAMEVFSKSIPFGQLRNLKDEFALIALFIGVGGFLDGASKDDYIRELKKEWNYRKKQFAIADTARIPWKFSKMRPTNTPVIRLLQLAQLLAQKDVLHNADRFLVKDGEKDLANFDPPEYWKTHIRPGVVSEKSFSNFTANSGALILLNAIAPVVFTQAVQQQNDDKMNLVLDFLRSLPPENNRITRIFTEDGWSNDSALDSQAFIQTHRNYCVPKKCLSCSIGVELLKSEDEP